MARKPNPVRTVGRRIRALRVAADMTIEVLSSRSGLSVGHISKIENAVQIPTVRSLYAVAKALRVEVVDLVIEPTASLRHAAISATGELREEELAARLDELEVEAGERPKKKRRTSGRRRVRGSSRGRGTGTE